MYEELVKRLRNAANERCFIGCFGICNHCVIGEALNQAANAIEELSKPKWIPVTERLPDNIDEEVLVCTEDYGKSGLGFATVAVYDGSDWIECWERKTYLTAVTNWMPLPEPPKEE